MASPGHRGERPPPRPTDYALFNVPQDNIGLLGPWHTAGLWLSSSRENLKCNSLQATNEKISSNRLSYFTEFLSVLFILYFIHHPSMSPVNDTFLLFRLSPSPFTAGSYRSLQLEQTAPWGGCCSMAGGGGQLISSSTRPRMNPAASNKYFIKHG